MGPDKQRKGTIGVFEDVTEQDELHRKLQRYAVRLHVLHEADRAILEARSIEETATAVLSHLRELVSLPRASVTLFDLEENRLTVAAVVPQASLLMPPGWSGPLDVAWFLDALKQGQEYRAENLSALQVDSPWIQALRNGGVSALISLPLIAQGELLGSLNLGLAAGADLSGEDAEIIREIAGELAVAVQQAHLQAHLRRHADELESLVAQRTDEVRASEERYRSLFERSVDGILLSAPDGRIFAANASACRMLGRTEEEICQLGRNGIVDSSDPRLTAALEERARTGLYSAELLLIRKDGTRFPCEVTSGVFHDRDGNLRTSMIIRDVTTRKQADAALIQAEKLAVVGRLTASLTHEINNPLQSVMGCLGLAREALAEGESADRYLDVALSELRRAADIVSRLRDLHGRPHLQNRQPADPQDLLEHVLTLTRKKCTDRRIAISCEAEAGLPRIMVARDQMIQVLLNIILNAIDAMPDGGHLRLAAAAQQEPPGVTLTIADTGVGMDEETLAHLFEAFHTTKAEGLGLGLYISRNIIQDHGGRIEATSRPGQGTIFRIWLPLS